jgi:signal transduction histidine kinase
MSYLLHPPLLDEAGLEAAVRWFCQGFSSRSGIEVALNVPEGFHRLPSEIETALFRIVQESLTNIHRHSGSPTARIRMRQRQDRVLLSICDQGRGIAHEQLRELRSGVGGAGVGLPGMRERIRKLGGSFALRARSVGLTILVSVPYKEKL